MFKLKQCRMSYAPKYNTIYEQQYQWFLSSTLTRIFSYNASRYRFYQLSLGIKPMTLHFYSHSLPVESLNHLDQMSLTDQIMFDHVQPVVFNDMLLYRLGFSNQKVSSFIPPTAKKRTEFYCIPNVLMVCKYQDKSTNIRVSEQMHIILHFPLYYLVIFFVLCFIYLSTSWQDQLGNVGLVKLILIFLSCVSQFKCEFNGQ